VFELRIGFDRVDLRGNCEEDKVVWIKARGVDFRRGLIKVCE